MQHLWLKKKADKPVVIALREIAEGKIDETILSKPLAEKEAWEQEEGLLVQSNDIGPAIADTDSHGDINEIKDSDASADQNNNAKPQQELDSENEGSKKGKA